MLNTQFLDMQIGMIRDRQSRLRWLVEQGVTAERVAHFGCSIGGQTLALMASIGANKAVGLDINEDSIRQARSTLRNTQEDVIRTNRYVQFYQSELSDLERMWWERVPEFFKKQMIQPTFSVSYIVQDITKKVDLENNQYDLVFCDFVLHHIWYDDERENAEQDTQFAIREMARVAQVGGFVAAYELIMLRDKPRLDFNPLFENAGLELVFTDEKEATSVLHQELGLVAHYLYSKPD